MPGALDLRQAADALLFQTDHSQQPGTAGLRTIDLGYELAAIAARADQAASADPVRLAHAHNGFAVRFYSRISSVNRRCSFIPAAPNSVRIERAVRPCFPITFP